MVFIVDSGFVYYCEPLLLLIQKSPGYSYPFIGSNKYSVFYEIGIWKLAFQHKNLALKCWRLAFMKLTPGARDFNGHFGGPNLKGYSLLQNSVHWP